MNQPGKSYFGMMDIPLTCSVFLEPALKRFQGCLAPISDDTSRFIHEWNICLIDTLKQPEYRPYLGQVGRKVIKNTLGNKDFPTKCVEHAPDVHVQSLHYAIRFTEGLKFLQSKIDSNQTNRFIDLGCGLSPMTGIVHAQYDCIKPYCIDVPEITNLYCKISDKLNGRVPESGDWESVIQTQPDTVIALGVFPYMEMPEQIAKLKYINDNISNFMLEIKYTTLKDGGKNPNVFDLKKLQQLQMDVKDTHNIETTVLRNTVRYLHKFISALPDRRYFVATNRSLFLSR